MAAQAHLKGNIIYYVQRKYCEKISSRFVKKYSIKLNFVMSASDQISPYHLFISRYVCMNASQLNQRG